MAVAMLQDMSRCIGCKACQVACKEWNELPAVETRNEGDYENPRDLGPTTWTRVQFQELDNGGEPRWLFFKQQCMHCTDAACVRVCPTGALKHDSAGFVSFERDLCNGCGYCADFCPYGAIRMGVDSVWTGGAKAAKCTLCEDRIANGQEPACAKACPADAIQFGDREELIAAGEERVAALQGQGRKDANLYGVKEAGGGRRTEDGRRRRMTEDGRRSTGCECNALPRCKGAWPVDDLQVGTRVGRECTHRALRRPVGLPRCKGVWRKAALCASTSAPGELLWGWILQAALANTSEGPGG